MKPKKKGRKARTGFGVVARTQHERLSAVAPRRGENSVDGVAHVVAGHLPVCVADTRTKRSAHRHRIPDLQLESVVVPVSLG